MSKIRVAVVSYGNIGKFSVEAIQAAPDMELAGVVRRAGSTGNNPPELADIKVVSDISELGKVDVAVLCSPTRSIPQVAKAIMEKGICTVDSFDIHGDEMLKLRSLLDETGKKHNSKAIISAGWDPGSDSVVRTLLLAMAPKGLTYTNFGPGMSMGHSVVAKGKDGVKDALSMTIPTGTGIHRRMVYVELEAGADADKVAKDIKVDSYFCNDETHVIPVPSVDDLKDMGHGVLLEHKGVSGKTQNQLFEFKMKINNPALTAQILISCARAALKQKPGAYTMPEIPPIDYLVGDKDALLKKLV
ncbi:diaminopimelate dehydrogenase [Natronoflexus pectinivorans]|uniref:Meso-diaminopimelate D-dehydrogenase n=1 Tax=Natronoflexus pectinivorans TaxID=682526 RepID=A0A4R2GFR3_9BACT|nr:diaminopimelate dehydrogenase [Natronoflexus pectinivorans]TCO06139.1 diaminopimelate dehydrogenase [Natronoflexus pectinivorans]